MKQAQLTARHQAMLDDALGPLILEALATLGTCEVLVNPDGTVWQEVHGQAMVCLGTQEPRSTEAAIRLIATLNGKVIHAGKPSLDAVLPGGQRFKGFLPPRTSAPAYCIRVHAAQVLSRDDYVPHVCPGWVWDLLVQAIRERQNLLIVGAMASGKTSLFNALIRYIPDDVRVASVEDTAESSISVPNYLQLYSTEGDLQEVVKDGFRTAARRILVGEIRDGLTAINTCKVWLGVGGGIATMHADSARDALVRLAYLCAETSPGQYAALLGDVIDVIAFMEQVGGQRLLSEVLKVHKWKDGQYADEMVFDRRRHGVAAP